jgi:hypothetical protein
MAHEIQQSGQLSISALAALANIDFDKDYYQQHRVWPCQAKLKDGRWLPRVLLVERKEIFTDRPHIAASEISEIAPSPHHLPIRFIQKLREEGIEPKGDCYLFRIYFKQAIMADYAMGDAPLFPDYPSGMTSEDVTNVRGWRHLGYEEMARYPRRSAPHETIYFGNLIVDQAAPPLPELEG